MGCSVEHALGYASVVFRAEIDEVEHHAAGVQIKKFFAGFLRRKGGKEYLRWFSTEGWRKGVSPLAAMSLPLLLYSVEIRF